MFGDSVTSALVQRALDGVWQRQKAISANIANFETPHYKASFVSFEEELAAQIAQIADRAKTRKEIKEQVGNIKESKITTEVDRSISMRYDGNNVDMENENVEMVKAQLQYMYLTNNMTKMYSRMRTAVKGQ